MTSELVMFNDQQNQKLYRKITKIENKSSTNMMDSKKFSNLKKKEEKSGQIAH